MKSKTCPYCKKEIKPGNHIYNCAKLKGIIKDKKDIKFDWYFFFFEWKDITKNNIDIKIEYIKYFESLKISKFNKS